MTQTEDPRRDADEEPGAEPAPPPQESPTPPHGDPLADQAIEDDEEAD
jgi:hypothetical protein